MNVPRPLACCAGRTVSAAAGRPRTDTVAAGISEALAVAHDFPRSFHAVPADIATALYWTGIDPFTKEEVYVAKGLRDRKIQRALMQFFKPENWFTVREALIEAGRTDLVGSGCDCLIPVQPPKEAIEARRRRANDPDHYHTVANPTSGEKPGERGAVPLKTKGYRPGRKGARRQDRHPMHKGGDSGARP